jgi:hypothetical protein
VEKYLELKEFVSTSFTARILSPDFKIVWRYLSLISVIRKVSSENHEELAAVGKDSNDQDTNSNL